MPCNYTYIIRVFRSVPLTYLAQRALRQDLRDLLLLVVLSDIDPLADRAALAVCAYIVQIGLYKSAFIQHKDDVFVDRRPFENAVRIHRPEEIPLSRTADISFVCITITVETFHMCNPLKKVEHMYYNTIQEICKL